jgi:hypothetical protein
MRNFKAHAGRILELLLSVAIFAQVPVTGSVAASRTTTVPVTDYVVILPIDVCSTDGKTCNPYNNIDSNPNPDQSTVATPIGWVDTATNTNITRKIWLQTGIDVTFLTSSYCNGNCGSGAIPRYNSGINTGTWNGAPYSTDYQTLHVTCTTGCLSTDFSTLSLGQPSGFPTPASGCSKACNDPANPVVFPALATANAIPMFFVNTIQSTAPGTTYGFSWIGRGGISIASSTFFPSTPGLFPRPDTLAHEIGHTLNLDHGTYGAGAACSVTYQKTVYSGCNLMDGGDFPRVVPNSTGTTAPTGTTQPNTGGVLFDLSNGLADQLILGTSTSVQQGQALLSGFLNPIPNVNATAGGGAAATTAAATTSTITSAASPTSPDLSFTVTYPKFKQAGGRSNNEYIMAIIIALPLGDNFATTPPFTQTGGSAQWVNYDLINGNNGNGNSNCLKPQGSPSIKCLEIDFQPGTFTTGTSFSFTSDIVNASGPVTSPEGIGITFVFNDLFATTSRFSAPVNGVSTTNSQTPDPTVMSQIVDPARFAAFGAPANFVGFTNTPCTLTNQGSCPPVTANSTGGDDTAPIGVRD